MAKFQTDEQLVSRIFLRDLRDDTDFFIQNRKTFIVVGTVVQICKNNDMICSFVIEDFDGVQVVESFADKLPFEFHLQAGDIYEIKGNFVLNKFNERVIRVLKIRKILQSEEMVHYLEVLYAQKTKTSSTFHEETALFDDCKAATESRVMIAPSNEIIKKKIASLIFSYGMKNYEKHKDSNGLVKRQALIDNPEIQAIKLKLNDDDLFSKMLEEAFGWLELSELIGVAHSDIIFNLQFFENIDFLFLDALRQVQNNEFTFRSLYIKFNDMINDNPFNMITKECVYEYVNKLLYRKQLVKVENKKETFKLI
jgi:hypothetical protein